LLIDKKRKEPMLTPHFAGLVKRVTELHDTGIRACHYTKEFTLR
jgi:hypothetical protein